MGKLEILNIDSLREKKLLDFLNNVQTVDQLSKMVIDDPKSGTPGKGYKIGKTVSKRILDKRKKLKVNQFNSVSELEEISGFGQDKLNDLIYTISKRNIKKPFVSNENWNIISKAVEATFEPDERKKIHNHIQEYKNVANILNNLTSDAFDFNRGDIEAGERMILLLNSILKRDFHANPSNPSNLKPISGSFASISIPNPNHSVGSHPCFFIPFPFVELFFALERLRLLRPGIDEAVTQNYLQAVDNIVISFAPVDILYKASLPLTKNTSFDINYFRQAAQGLNGIDIINRNHSLEILFKNDFPNGSKEKLSMKSISIGTFPYIDLCRAERMARTHEAVTCFKKLHDSPRIVIEDIVNLSKPGVSRRGCAGDRMEIQGSHLGNLGELSIGRTEIITEEWDNEHILFELPIGLIGNSINLCVNPMIPECSGFALACKLAEEGTDYSFEVVEAPEIAFFNPNGPTVRPIEDEQYESEACTNVELNFLTQHAEQVIIRNSDGTTVWDSASGIPRRIDSASLASPLIFRDLQSDTTFTLEATNLCGTITRDISMTVYHAIHLESAPRLLASESLNINIQISCPAPTEGVEIMLSTSIPGIFDLPADPIIIPEGETRTMHIIDALMNCAETTLTASAPDHREDEITLFVYDRPEITQIAPLAASACSPINLTIQGDCFDPQIGGNEIIARNGSDTRRFTNNTIRFLDPANRGHNAEIEASIANLSPGNWDISIQSNGLESDSFLSPLISRAVPAIIHDFSSNLTQIVPCVENRVTLTWEVSRISRIEIYNGGSLIHSPPSMDSCSRQTSSTTITLSEGTELRLLAYPIGGLDSVEGSLTISEIPYPQASTVRLENLTRGRWFPEHTLTIWTWNRRDGASKEDTITHGESINIALDDCIAYTIYAVSHQWIDEYNRIHRTALSPDDSEILLYPNVHKYTVPDINIYPTILGRDGRGTVTHRIEPGG